MFVPPPLFFFLSIDSFLALRAFGSQSSLSNSDDVIILFYLKNCVQSDFYFSRFSVANQAIVDKTVLATKFLAVRDAAGNFVGTSAKPELSRSSCDKSLQILPKIDIFYMHRFAGDCTIEEAMSGLAALVKEGKVKSIGLSEVSAATLERAHAVHPVACVEVSKNYFNDDSHSLTLSFITSQIEYSLWTRDIETNGLLDMCRKLGVVVVAYSPLGRGMLSGNFRSPADLKPG